MIHMEGGVVWNVERNSGCILGLFFSSCADNKVPCSTLAAAAGAQRSAKDKAKE